MFRSRNLPVSAFIALLVSLLCVAGGGCTPSDPLEAIRIRQASGDMAGTLEPLRELLEERRDDPEAQFLYGRALTFTGQASLAEWSLRAAMEDPEWRLPAGLLLANSALRTGNFPTVIEITSRLLEEHPESVETLLVRASAHAHSKLDPEAALADVERVLEIDPENLEAMEPRILALLTLERVEEAGEAIDELGRMIDAADPGEAVPAWHCATAAIFADESGEAELAEERWAQCLEAYPAQGDVVSKAIVFYDSRQQYDRSLEILRRAHSEDPNSRAYRVALATRLRGIGENAEAEALLRAATEDANRTLAASAWIDLAKHQQALEDNAAAAQSVGEAVAIAREIPPPSPELLLEYADALLLAGEFDRALEITEEMELPAHRAMIHARVAQERGQPAEALAYFEAAFQLWPDNLWARYMAARAAESVGDFDRAVEAYRYAIRIGAGETDARVRVARIHLAEGKAAEAILLLRFKSEVAPLDLEGELLSVRAWAAAGQLQELGRVLEVFRRESPGNLGAAVAHAAEGTASRAGPVAAEAGSEAQGAAAAEATVRSALKAHPEVAAFHEILGLALELRGAPAAETSAAYARASELDAENARALGGLGRLALTDDPEAALGYFDRAAAADPSAAEPGRGAARALVALGRKPEAEERLEAVLVEHPIDADAAAELAELHLARDLASERTLELAERAVRFGGGADALDRLGRVHQVRGEAELAAGAAERAQALREPADG
jgi:tetratricopeptide (TPR) repeat protein